MDIFSREKRSAIMSKIKGKDSKLEVQFRKMLWRKGYRYVKNSIKYFGKPDLVLKKYRAVIFIDSCFWHNCAMHGEIPSTRQSFWKIKLQKNSVRDAEVTKYYKDSGWIVVRIWEHDLKRNLIISTLESTISTFQPKSIS